VGRHQAARRAAALRADRAAAACRPELAHGGPATQPWSFRL